MINVGYFNCLYAAALTARALSEIGCNFSLLISPIAPTHPYVQLTHWPEHLFSFHHDGLRHYQGRVRVPARS